MPLETLHLLLRTIYDTVSGCHPSLSAICKMWTESHATYQDKILHSCHYHESTQLYLITKYNLVNIYGIRVLDPIQQGVLRYHQGIWEFNMILTPFTWRQHQIPQVKGLILQDCPCFLPTHFRCQTQIPALTCTSDKPAIDWRFQWPPPNQNVNCKSRVLPVLLTDCYKLEVPPTPSLGLIC